MKLALAFALLFAVPAGHSRPPAAAHRGSLVELKTLVDFAKLLRPAPPYGQLLPESLWAWATLPACETRPISRFDVPPVNSSVRFFGRIPVFAVCPGSGCCPAWAAILSSSARRANSDGLGLP